MADRYDGGARQAPFEQPVERGFARFVERGGGLVQKQIVRRVQHGAGDAEPLLLAERQHPVPMRLLVDPGRERRQADGGDHLGTLAGLEASGSAG